MSNVFIRSGALFSGPGSPATGLRRWDGAESKNLHSQGQRHLNCKQIRTEPPEPQSLRRPSKIPLPAHPSTC